MKFVLAPIAAAAVVLVAGHVPASAATASQGLVNKPAYTLANAVVEKTGRRHCRWITTITTANRRHRHHRRRKAVVGN